MKQPYLLACALSIAAVSCSKPTQQSKPIVAPEPVIVKTVDGLMQLGGFKQLQSLLQADAQRMLCVQPMYQQCLNIRRYTCESEIQPWVLSCLAYAKQQVAMVNDQISRDQYMGAYGSCLINKHALSKPNQYEEISLCLYNVELDERLGIEALIADRPFYQK